MTQKEKILLLQDLCARLPYDVKCCYDILSGEIKIDTLICINKVIIGQGIYWDFYFENCDEDIPLETVKPYLRPLSSMTEEEKKEYGKVCELDTEILANHTMNGEPFPALYNSQDWLNKNMFDYRGLIPMGLALEAPEGMYSTW